MEPQKQPSKKHVFFGPGAPESEHDAEMAPKWGPRIVTATSEMHPFCGFNSVLAPRVPQGAFLSHFDTIFAHFGTKNYPKMTTNPPNVGRHFGRVQILVLTPKLPPPKVTKITIN